MKRICLAFCLLAALSAGAQTKMKEVFAEAPDSIFPLLTKNNKLDCIDFRENNMQAVVTNRWEGQSELLTLTVNYLKLQLSDRESVEMKLLNDSTLCMVRTYKGPAEDSQVCFYNTKWEPLKRTANRPEAKEFLSADTDEDVRLSLEALPLMKASLSPDDNTITWELQTTELTKDQQKLAAGKTHAIKLDL